MTENLEKETVYEASLPITQFPFNRFRHTTVQSSQDNPATQLSLKFPLQTVAEKSTVVQDSSCQCRICLQSQSQSGQPFIRPCNCTGSVQYIHLTCFTEWIRTSLMNKQNKELQQIQQSGLKCDLCKMPLEINIGMQKTFVGLQKLKERIKRNPVYFALLIFMLIGIIVLLCFSAVLLPSSPLTFASEFNSQDPGTKDKAIQKVTMFCCLIVSILVLFLIIFLIFRDFLIGREMKVWSNGKNNLKIDLKGIFNR